MAEKEHHQQAAYPNPTNGYARPVDTEAGGGHTATREQRKKKRTKCFLYIILFIIFQTAIITLFAMTIMKVKTPRFRIRGATVTALSGEAPSMRATITPEFSLKNTNFGRYKYHDTTVDFFHRGTKIGEVLVPGSKAGWRSTKRFIVSAVDLNLSGSPQLAGDVSTGVVPITSSAQMRGRAELIFIMKKNKGTNMNCTMEIVIASQTIRNISCK